ncbi:hypothetical protein GDO78_017922 [Eleutherodactylus coqui]|uniref:Uncharacterized protein n=1 Tax=Eleutherodactylus coqui TaxID=57060 RepID=A0A8J6ENE0_ELECQ|nr:hypothetical protein GDO78_017922 [Eleutherodactylus coqui]
MCEIYFPCKLRKGYIFFRKGRGIIFLPMGVLLCDASHSFPRSPPAATGETFRNFLQPPPPCATWYCAHRKYCQRGDQLRSGEHQLHLKEANICCVFHASECSGLLEDQE